MPDTDVLTPDKVISSRRSLPIGQCPKGLDQTLPGALHPRVVQRLQIKEQVEPSEVFADDLLALGQLPKQSFDTVGHDLSVDPFHDDRVQQGEGLIDARDPLSRS